MEKANTLIEKTNIWRKWTDAFRSDSASVYYLLIGPPFLILFSLTAGPLIVSVFMSLLDWNLAKPTDIDFIGLGNFMNMIVDMNFWNAILLTIYQVGATVIGQLILGIGIALLLSREFKGVQLLRSLYLIPMMTTPIVVGMTWRMLFNTDMGIINYFLSLIGISPINWLGSSTYAMPSIILTDLWLSTPFVAVILIAGLQSLPKEPIEAAKIDGATTFQIFYHIILPLLKPIIWLAVLFRTMDAIRRFETIFVMTAGGPGNSTETLNLHAYFHAFKYLEIGYSSALSVLMLIIIFTSSMVILRKVQQDQL
ncbi:carbohydrate ABC transporter permease [Fredinandcohnia onubensis]|uniref:carbohydrate ABC transporter permease n=1 Tax=Fredinandcohnia onubensis TaxID=1571209 RepID=UPI000C0BE475|nr:sugar ABC transporter permease [Fredinandcohnia onubensis]